MFRYDGSESSSSGARLQSSQSLRPRFRSLTLRQRRAFLAAFLGWSLDAFDFFLLTFCLDSIAHSYGVSMKVATTSIFWTLCMRPVGALLFGLLAERFGRRPALMINILCFSAFEFGSAFAPTFGSFLVMRALFGVAMGGEWGVGAALALETLPPEGRGFFSGLLQEGYVVGNLLAALVYGTVFPFLGHMGHLADWRWLFVIGALPSFLVFYIRGKVEESPAWRSASEGASHGASGMPNRHSFLEILRQIGMYLPQFLFLVLLMTGFNSFSHGTQDLYPTLLKGDHHLSVHTVSWIAIAGNFGALFGGMVCGTLSERWGRRRTIVIAALLAVPAIPLWAWSHTAVLLALGGFVMQFMVQGAWGVIPAHLNELAPGPVRALFPGLAYQIGNLLSSRNGVFQTAIAERYFGNRLTPVMCWTVLFVAGLVVLLASLGGEARGSDLSKA